MTACLQLMNRALHSIEGFFLEDQIRQLYKVPNRPVTLFSVVLAICPSGPPANPAAEFPH